MKMILKNEHHLKNENYLKHEDNLKNKDDYKMKKITYWRQNPGRAYETLDVLVQYQIQQQLKKATCQYVRACVGGHTKILCRG